jgi:protein involved in polysaccharide export with SLBB domain
VHPKRSWHLSPAIKWSLQAAGGSLLLVLAFSCAVNAQQKNNNTTTTSELATQNLSRVAATTAEIKSILLKDSGLMVELKRWVAKDATDHGQIVSDPDLTNENIFERLEMDVQFRSVATMLLQRYGYLIPKLNPESDAAKEHELLIAERTKRLAQIQEEELAKAREADAKNLQQLAACDRQRQEECNIPQNQTTPAGGFGQGPQQGEPSNGILPGAPNPSILPLPNTGGNPTIRTQLTPPDQGFSGQPFQLPLPGSYDSGSSPSMLNVGALDSLSSAIPGAGLGSMSGASLSRGNIGTGGGMDGLLAAYGSGTGIGMGMGMGIGMGINSPMGGLQEPNPMDRLAAGSSLTSGNASISQMMPSDRRFRRVAPPEPAEMMRKASPYTDIPSLYDMYVQAVTRPTSPRRFGAEVFENGTRDSQLIPMDLPVGPDYVVGPGDGLSVDLWGGVSQRLYRVVDREGRVSLPELGPVLVSGKSLAAVQQNLQQLFRTQYRDVSTDVSLSRLRTIRVYEVGDVANPGAYDISSLSTPLNALFVAGGPTQRGSMRILKHYRGTQLVETVDVYDLLLHGVKTDLQRLENGDTVQVPTIGPQVTVEGMVRRPAIYELQDEKSLASVLELAGGLLPTATLRHIEVQRIVAHEKQSMLSVDIPESESEAGVTQKLEAFQIQDGDRVRIYPIVPYNQDTIYLEGHVVRPGRYSYRADMRVTDVITGYKDLLPEPATKYAEIVRLNAPDFHPSVEGFDLANAIENPSNAPILHPMDTLRIFSRFDFENPPAVSVLGDVREPGTYQTSGQIRLTDAVHLAGGLSPDAQTGDAQVFRYLPDGKFKIFSVSLSQALGGDPLENIVLQPRDRLLIHRNADAVEPASVYVQGEVARPGRYPLTTNMHVADLIRVGGGLTASADTQAADLTKYQYSDQAKLTGQQEVVALSSALANDSKANVGLHNGDVLTIRQLPDWKDLGASIALKGEIKHPGTYGIRPGERLSSILERAGGFQPDAYPYGAILQRSQVRELEAKAQNELILRVKDTESNLQLLPESSQKQKEAKEVALQQWQQTLEQLGANSPVGRVTIRISPQIDRWKNSPADIEVAAGDVLVIPKRPSYVMVTGQVFNPTAVSYRPGRSAKWYLSQSGGPNAVANKKAIFVIRADGSVIGAKGGMFSGDPLSPALQPGDTVVVPEKAFGGGVKWETVLLSAQTAASVSSAILIGLHY